MRFNKAKSSSMHKFNYIVDLGVLWQVDFMSIIAALCLQLLVKISVEHSKHWIVLFHTL